MNDFGWHVVAAIVVFVFGMMLGWRIHADAFAENCASFGSHRIGTVVYACAKK